MNIFINRFKVFIISFCLVSMFSFSYSVQRANANPAVIPIAGGAAITVGTAAEIIGGTILLGGSAYVATHWNSDCSNYVAQKMADSGNAVNYFGVRLNSAGQQCLTWTKEGFDSFISLVNDYQKSYPVQFKGDISLDGNTVVIPTSTNTNQSFVYHVGTATYNKDTDNFDITVQPTYFRGSIGWYANIVRVSAGTVAYNFSPVSAGSSICIPFDKPINNTGSISIPWNSANDVALPLQFPNDSGGVAVPFPNTSTGSVSYPFPSGTTWDNVKDKYYNPPVADTGNPAIPTTEDTTGTIDTGKGILDIPILGDILRVLQKILDFLGTLIGTLVTSLINALEQLLTKLFVPTADMFNDFYSHIESNVKSKFPYSVSILNSLKVNADEFKDIHVTIWGHDCVIVSARFVNDNISWIRVVTSCFWIFSLFVYVWRKINAVLSGGDVNSTTVYVPSGGGSGPPSII